VSATNVSISVSSVGGLNYTLEYKDAITNADWAALPPAVTGTGGTIILQDTNASQPRAGSIAFARNKILFLPARLIRK